MSAEHSLPVALWEHGTAAYAVRALTPHEVLHAGQEALVEAIAPAVAVIVDWSDLTMAAIPAARRIAGPCRVPVFALCGDTQADHVAALVVGADGTLERPVRPVLLEALLLAHRRLVGDASAASGDGHAAHPAALPWPEPTPRERDRDRVGPLALDRAARCVYVGAEELKLTPKEFDLLDYLMAHAGLCRTRDEILDHAWGIDFDPGTNILDVHIYELRKKLRAHALDGMLQTVRGMGFRLVAPR